MGGGGEEGGIVNNHMLWFGSSPKVSSDEKPMHCHAQTKPAIYDHRF